MNNEEKILIALENINKRFDGIDKRLDTELGQINKRLDTLEEDVTSIRGSVIVIENEHGQMIQALYDAVLGNIGKLSKLEPLELKVENHEDRIFALELAAKA